jgi:hypothetical protein
MRKKVLVERWFLVLLFTLSFASASVAVLLGAHENRGRISDNRNRIEDIQRSRAEVGYTTCVDQNNRHDETIRRLDALLTRLAKEQPARAGQIRATRSSTVFLIEALAPHQNCRQISLDRYGFVPDTERGDP